MWLSHPDTALTPPPEALDDLRNLLLGGGGALLIVCILSSLGKLIAVIFSIVPLVLAYKPFLSIFLTIII